MTYRTARSALEIGTMGGAALAFLLVPLVAVAGMAFIPAAAVSAVFFLAFYALRNAAAAALERKAYSLSFSGRETRIIMEFTERVGVCFTVLDLVDAIRDKLER